MKKIFPIIIFFIVSLGFYSPTIFKNKIPIPGDLLLGSYYPWLDYNWGYPVSVPVKNPLISDIYSQIYPWKSLIAESYRSLEIPLWNQYSYSGYPLMANFQSGAFNPFNLLMVIFGDQNGWTLMLISQTFLSMVFMYLLLKNTAQNYFANITSSIAYGLSPFLIGWSQFMTIGFAMLWIPLILYCIKKNKFTSLPILYFLLMTSGHMQSLIFGMFFSFIYYLYLNWSNLKSIKTLFFISSLAISLGYMLIQIIPTLEMSQLSVRFSENYITNYDYGLLPLSKLITLFSPDFFGNPTTGNYWGYFNYQETIVYINIFGFIALLYSVFNLKQQNKDTKFFTYASIISLLLIFDNPISRLIYILKIPFISTSSGGRMAIIFTLTSIFLINNLLSKLSTSTNKKHLYFPLFLIFSLTLSQLLLSFILKNYFRYQGIQTWYQNMNTGFRNTALYLLIALAYILIICLSTKSKNFIYIITILIIGESFRFGWKYIPFISKELVFAKTPVIEYLKTDPEKYFRVMAEKGPILPANSWTIYRLSSPVGYDPMAIKKYFIYYNQNVNDRSNDNGVSRYLEPENYPAKTLGNYNLKYLLAIKYDKNGYVSADGNINNNINPDDWEKVFDDRSVTILKNKFYKPRVEIITEGNNTINATAKIAKYSANSVTIDYSIPPTAKGELLLRDSWYPGWQANNNGRPIQIKEKSIFRTIEVSGNGSVTYSFFPSSVKIGIIAFAISMCLNGLLFFIIHKHQNA